MGSVNYCHKLLTNLKVARLRILTIVYESMLPVLAPTARSMAKVVRHSKVTMVKIVNADCQDDKLN